MIRAKGVGDADEYEARPGEVVDRLNEVVATDVELV